MSAIDPTDCPASRWVKRTRTLVDLALHRLLPATEFSPVVDAMRYSTLAPGKRIRPLLTLAVIEFLGPTPAAAVQVACAIEMIHAASLILDDLPCMDNDRQRRNRPATHAKFGESLTILAAVSLLTQSWRTIASHASLAEDTRLHLIGLLCETVGPQGLSLGQYIDLHGGRGEANADTITDIHHLKTGVLFLAAAKAGCVLGKATTMQTEKVMCFTRHLGLAFQLLDDLKDREEMRTNMVTRIGMAGAQRRLQEHLLAARNAIAEENHAKVLLDLMQAFFRSAEMAEMFVPEQVMGPRRVSGLTPG